MQTDTLGTENGTAVREQDGGGGLQEEEGLLGSGVIQLSNVIAGRWCVSDGVQIKEIQRYGAVSQAG